MKINIMKQILILLGLIAMFTSCEKNSPPTCSILSPESGYELFKGDTLLISVDATDNDGNLSNILLFIDNSEVSSSFNLPYSFSWITQDAPTGKHTIMATAFDDEGESCSGTVDITILAVPAPPLCSFQADKTIVEVSDSIRFTDLSTNSPTNWFWDFGDGETSTSQNPNHVYQETGTYSVSLSVSNSDGADSLSMSDYINVIPDSMSQPCPGIPWVTDAEGNKYNTVQIGSQCWMAENLNIGSIISSVDRIVHQTNNNITEKYCYNNNPANCSVYGGLYEWDEMMQYVPYILGEDEIIGTYQGICPTGWHIPTRHEYDTLVEYLGGRQVAGGKLKEAGTNHWEHPNLGATNQSGFTALPGGYKSDISGSFDDLGEYCHFWTASSYLFETKWMASLSAITRSSDHSKNIQYFAFSVRCVKN